MVSAPQVREAVGVFQSETNLKAAIDELLSHGFDRSEINLLASVTAVEQKLGHAFRSVKGLEDDPDVPTVAFVSTETIGDAEGAVIGSLLYVGALAGMVGIVASGGAMAAALAAGLIGGGSGAAIGAVLARMIGKRYAGHIEHQLQHGGLMLWVRTWNTGDEARAVNILKRHSGEDVHVHGLPDHVNQGLATQSLRGAIDSERLATDLGTITTTADGQAYAVGKIFPTATDAQAYLERRDYLKSLYEEAQAQSFDLEAALLDPADMFDHPAQLMATALSAEIKTEILKRWAYDQKELEAASDEGMPELDGGDLLQHIENAIATLQT